MDSTYSTAYVYGQDGQRSNKYTQNSETLYFNKMWTLHTDSGNNIYGGQSAKNIYLGETRIVTKLNSGVNPTYQAEYYKQYFYHSDHLGSASLISDYKGDEYQRIEYTPYGESWVEKTQNVELEYLPYKFTSKELDEETGLYYYGARYLDPKYSRWISTDPALGEYIPAAPVSDEARRHNENLPGMGGVYNYVNFNLYHYAGNNPVKYVDPDGRSNYDTVYKWLFEAFQFIKDNALDEYDYLLVNKLTEMLNSGKIQFDDTSKRYENLTIVNSGSDRESFFDPYRNTETGEKRNIIVIDPDRICENGGFPELIEVLAHEGWHAVQSEYNLISVDEDNNMQLKLGILETEKGAYNMGRKFYDRYATQNNLKRKGPVDIEWLLENVFTE